MLRLDFANNRGENLSDPKYDKDAVNLRTLRRELSNFFFTGSTGGGGGGVEIDNYGNNRILTSTGTISGITAESNFTFDGTDLTLKGALILNSTTHSGLGAGVHICSTVATSLGDGAYFDYSVKSGTIIRLGTVMAAWNGTGAEFTDVSTNDLGGDTSVVTFSVDLSGTDARFIANINSGSWTIKNGIRII